MTGVCVVRVPGDRSVCIVLLGILCTWHMYIPVLYTCTCVVRVPGDRSVL